MTASLSYPFSQDGQNELVTGKDHVTVVNLFLNVVIKPSAPCRGHKDTSGKKSKDTIQSWPSQLAFNLSKVGP